MNLVKNSRLDPSQNPLVKQNYGCSSEQQKGPALALGFPPRFQGPGSRCTKTPSALLCDIPAQPGPRVTAWLRASHQQSPSAVATGHHLLTGFTLVTGGHCGRPHPLPTFLRPFVLGGPGFLELSQNCGHIPSGNRDIFRFT